MNKDDIKNRWKEVLFHDNTLKYYMMVKGNH